MGFLIMETKTWYLLKGFDGFYEINKKGEVRSTLKRRCFIGRKPKGEKLKLRIARSGYWQVSLRKPNEKQTSYFIHRLLAINFIPNPENKPCINHIDSNRLNNNLENLEWCTYSENNKHAYKSGMQIKTFGETHNQTILNESQVIEIRNKYVKNIYTMKMLSKEYGVSVGAIQAVIIKKSWSHI